MKFCKFEAGENCINYGDHGDEFFIILKGTC